MSTDDEALAAMTRTFPVHELLRARWRVGDAPRPGSELERADGVWPHLPFSEHARQCLAAAWDHFDLVRLTVEARRTFPTGLNGVLRGGLVASAMALWLLGPDEAGVRDERGLALTDEWYHRRLQYQRGVLAIADDENERGHAQLRRLEEDRQQARALRRTAVQVEQ